MLKIYSAENMVDAQLFKDWLESDCIEAVIKGGYLSGAVGELPTSDLITVWIIEDTYESRARKRLIEFEEKQRKQVIDVYCQHCGNRNPGSFDLCWSCGKNLGKNNSVRG